MDIRTHDADSDVDAEQMTHFDARAELNAYAAENARLTEELDTRIRELMQTSRELAATRRANTANAKAAAEHHVRHILQRAYIVRTAWLYAAGGRNFIHAILNRARSSGQLRVVTDEVGNPTYAKDMAEAIAQLIQTHQYGTYHFVNSGSCSRWEFANEILRQAGLTHVVNTPILGSEFKRASTPPPYAVLHNIAAAAIGIRLRPWQEALADYLQSVISDQ